MNDLVSVIIPYYKDKEYIEFSINSVLKQSYKKFEIIIIDDENSNSSNEVLKKLKIRNKN